VLFLGPNHCTMVMYDVNLTGSWVRGNEKALYYFSNFPVSLKLLQNETVQHDILWKVRLLESTIGDKIPPRGSEWGEGWGGNTLISHRSWEFGDRLGSHSPSGCSWGSPLRWSWQLKSLQWIARNAFFYPASGNVPPTGSLDSCGDPSDPSSVTIVPPEVFLLQAK
jgi:hypothetical protein